MAAVGVNHPQIAPFRTLRLGRIRAYAQGERREKELLQDMALHRRNIGRVYGFHANNMISAIDIVNFTCYATGKVA